MMSFYSILLAQVITYFSNTPAPVVSVKRTNAKHTKASSTQTVFEFALVVLMLVRFTLTKGTGVSKNYVL